MPLAAETERRLTVVVGRLGELADQVVFVGGAVVGCLVTDPGAPPPRMTGDVDLVVQVTTTADYQGRLRDALIARGFVEDTSEGAPLCRWLVGGVIVDVMPSDPRVLGFANRWHDVALLHAVELTLGTGARIRIVTAPVFVALKLEAYRGRGGGDLMASHDLEDVVAVLDGRDTIEAEIAHAPDQVRAYLSEALRALLSAGFRGVLAGHLAGDAANQARLPRLLARLERLAEPAV